MAFLRPALLSLRHDARILRIPPYLSLLCIVAGVAWLFLLPLNEYSRGTYVSENALLPAQVHTYFGGSEHNVFRAYRHEVAALVGWPNDWIAYRIGEIFESQGLKVGKQKYKYESSGTTISGENVYGILQGPRADATEALVLLGAWKNMDDIPNQSGVALVLTLARYFKRWSLWSKDIIFVVTSDSVAGPQAWVDAYHEMHSSPDIDGLPIKAGALQGAIALDYPAGTSGHRYDKLHIVYDGVNGQLPNLDLINTIAQIAREQVNMKIVFQRVFQHADTYKDRLQTMLHGMLTQGLGRASGPHSAFMPYHVDAITLQTIGDGWHDEMSLGKVVEGGFRSLNNLLEHLHQSFFFYLLMESRRFVSIGTYLPSAMAIAVNFSIMALALWVQSGRPEGPIPEVATSSLTASASKPVLVDGKEKKGKTADFEVIEHRGMVAVVPAKMLAIDERKFFRPMALVLCAHLLGLVPLYMFNNLLSSAATRMFIALTVLTPLLPIIFAFILHPYFSAQALALSSCFSLLLLGIYLSTLSTINFSLGLITGLLASPLTFLTPPSSSHSVKSSSTSTPPASTSSSSSPSTTVTNIPNKSSTTNKVSPRSTNKNTTIKSIIKLVLLALVSPPTVIFLGSWIRLQGIDSLEQVLRMAQEAWVVGGTWTSVVIWIVWFPAWLVGGVVVACEAFSSAKSRSGLTSTSISVTPR